MVLGRGELTALIVEASPSSLIEMVGTETELADLPCEGVVEAAAVMDGAGARDAAAPSGESVAFEDWPIGRGERGSPVWRGEAPVSLPGLEDVLTGRPANAPEGIGAAAADDDEVCSTWSGSSRIMLSGLVSSP